MNVGGECRAVVLTFTSFNCVTYISREHWQWLTMSGDFEPVLSRIVCMHARTVKACGVATCVSSLGFSWPNVLSVYVADGVCPFRDGSIMTAAYLPLYNKMWRCVKDRGEIGMCFLYEQCGLQALLKTATFRKCHARLCKQRGAAPCSHASHALSRPCSTDTEPACIASLKRRPGAPCSAVYLPHQQACCRDTNSHGSTEKAH